MKAIAKPSANFALCIAFLVVGISGSKCASEPTPQTTRNSLPRIDELSIASRLLIVSNETSVARGTCFLAHLGQRNFIITAQHLFSGINPYTGVTETNWVKPPQFALIHLTGDKGVNGGFQKEKLVDDTGNNLWFRDSKNPRIDVGVLPVRDIQPSELLVTLDLEADQNPYQLKVYDQVVTIGYPGPFVHRLSAHGAFNSSNLQFFPIWKNATIASEPAVPFDGLPVFLIDAVNWKGMSGAPVYRIVRPGELTPAGKEYSMSIGRRQALVGIQSLIFPDSELSMVVRAEIIRRIVDQIKD